MWVNRFVKARYILQTKKGKKKKNEKSSKQLPTLNQFTKFKSIFREVHTVLLISCAVWLFFFKAINILAGLEISTLLNIITTGKCHALNIIA